MATGQPVANYRGHDGRVLCVLCSDNDDDVVFSGGQDNTLQCWRISEQKHVKPQPGKNILICQYIMIRKLLYSIAMGADSLKHESYSIYKDYSLSEISVGETTFVS